MIIRYLKKYWKNNIFVWINSVFLIVFLLYACYNIPSYATYHEYIFTYLFITIIIYININFIKYQYRSFKNLENAFEEIYKKDLENILHQEGKTIEDIQCKTPYEYFELIHDIAVDYDGYRGVKGLMSLIDEIKEYSIAGMKMCKTKARNDNND